MKSEASFTACLFPNLLVNRRANTEAGDAMIVAIRTSLPTPPNKTHNPELKTQNFLSCPARSASPGNLSPHSWGDSSVGIAREERRGIRKRKKRYAWLCVDRIFYLGGPL